MNKMRLQCDDNGGSTNNFVLNLSRYYYTNKRDIATCEASEGWTNNTWNNTAGTYAADTTNYKVGNGAVKYTGTNAGGIHYAYSVAKDLTKFNDLSTASNTSDYITFQLYMDATSYANLNTAGITIKFHKDVFLTETNYVYYTIAKASLASGWNFISIGKSAFTVAGSGAWSSVTGVSLVQTVNAGGAVSVTIDNIEMIKKDPVLTAPNVFGADAAQQGTEKWFIGLDTFSFVVAKNINNTATGFSLFQNNGNTYTNFVLNYSEQVITAGMLAGFGLYIDALNYVIFFVTSNTATLRIVTGGVTVDSTLTIKSLAVNDIITAKLERYGTLIVFNLSINNIFYNFTGTFTPTSAGYLGIYTTSTINANIISANIYIPDQLIFDLEATSFSFPALSRAYNIISQFNNRASVFGMGTIEPDIISATTTFRKLTAGGTAINTTRDALIKWLLIAKTRNLYFYIMDSTERNLKYARVYPKTRDGENYHNMAISSDLSFSFQMEAGYFQDTKITRASYTMTGSGDTALVTNTGNLTTPPIIRFIPSVDTTVFSIQKAIGYGITLQSYFLANKEITYDCNTGLAYVNGQVTAGIQTAGSIFELDNGSNTLYITCSAGTLIIEYYARGI